jgi:parallel beta-helix repeat protein
LSLRFASLALGLLVVLIVFPFAANPIGVADLSATTGQLPQSPGASFELASQIYPFNLLPEVYAAGMHVEGIATGTGCTATTTTASATCSLTHAANALVVVNTAAVGTTSVSSVTVGGASATQLATVSSGSSETTEVWYVFRTPSGAETVTVTFSGTVRGAIVAQSFTGTVTTAPFFESTNTNSSSGLSAQIARVNVAAGTLGRRIFQAVGGAATAASAGSITVAAGSGQTEIAEADLGGSSSTVAVSEESNYLTVGDSSAARTMSATLTKSGSTIAWATVGTAILPSGSGVSIAKGSAGTATQLEPQRAIWQNPRGQKAFYAIVQGGTSPTAPGLGLYKSADGSSWTLVQQLAGTGTGYSATYSASAYPYDDGTQLVVYVCYAEGGGIPAGGTSKAVYYRRLLIPDDTDAPTVGAEQNTGKVGAHCNIARDRNGYVHILKWGSSSSNALVQIYGTTTTNSGDNPTWSADATVTSHGGSTAVDDTSAIAVFGGTTGNILGIVGQKRVSSENSLYGVNIASFNGATYSTGSGVIVESANGVYHPLDVVVDSNDVAYLVFHDARGGGLTGFRYTFATAARTVESWNTVTNVDSTAPDSASLSIDKSVTPNVLYAFYQKGTSDTVFWRSKAVDAASWSSENSIIDGSGEDLDWIQSGRELQQCVTPLMYTTQTNFYARFVKFTDTECAAAATATLTVKKLVVNDNGGTKTAGNFTLHVKSGGSDVTGSPAAGSETGTVYTLSPGTYVVSEDTPPTGYSQTGFSDDCDSLGSLTLTAGGSKTCTITNDDVQPKLTVIKKIVNDNGGSAALESFTLMVDGGAVSNATATGFNAGLHTVSETGQPGYAATFSGDCDSSGQVTLAVGEPDKACTITNDDVQPLLTVTKVVVNDNGGTAVVGNWTLTVDSTTFTSGVQQGINAGTYAVSEAGPSGYSGPVFSDDCDSSGSITLNVGDVKACTITNDDVQPKLTVIKYIVNDNGGTATLADFTLMVDGGAVSNATATGFNAGLHTVSESTLLSGYAAAIDGDCGSDGSITLSVGESETCTITNDDVQPKLTVVKAVKNDNGGEAAADAWKLYVGSTEVENGAKNGFNVGTYSVSEDGPSGYAATFSGACDLDGNVTLDLGDDVTCTITNDDQPGVLKVVKVLTNDNGGEKTLADFTIHVSGVNVNNTSPAASESGVFVSLDQGDYSVTEDAVAGYETTLSADCSGHMNIGDSKTCTITNDDIQPQLIVIKHVVTDNGGTNAASDWTMSVTSSGPSPSSFLGDESGTAVTLNVGSYNVTESGPVGYAVSRSADCEGSMLPGDIKTCTITNDDIQPKLTVTKVVVNDNGGKATAVQWTLTVDGTTFTSGVQQGIDAGTYTVSESAGPSGYSGPVFSDDCDSSGSITLSPGDVKACTVTNDDIQPKLTVTKVVTNDNGGTADVGEFTLKVGDTVVSSGVETGFNARDYTVSETGQPGYAATFSGDCDSGGQVTLAVGEPDKTCTITNDDIAPTLKVTKIVVNDNGATKQVSDFPLLIDGSATTSGEAVTLNAGLHAVNETRQTGYAATIGGDCAPNGTVTLKPGENKECIITNDDLDSDGDGIADLVDCNPAQFDNIVVDPLGVVPPSFLGTKFSTLQDAVNAAKDNDVISVCSADLSENVVIGSSAGSSGGKDLRIVGCGHNVIAANSSLPVITIESSAGADDGDTGNGYRDIHIDDLDVKGGSVGYLIETSKSSPGTDTLLLEVRSESNGVGIKVVGSGNEIRGSNGVKFNSGVGIEVIGDNNLITDNRVEENGGTGIIVVGAGNTVQENDVFANARNGIDVSGATNTVIKNDVGDGGKGNGGRGIKIAGEGNTIRENNVFANAQDGIFVSSNKNLILKNDVGDKGKGNGGQGINVAGSGNTIEENNVFANGGDGINVSGGSGQGPNVIFKNSVGDENKGNGGNGITVAGAGNVKKSAVGIEQNTVTYNAKEGIRVSGSQHQLKNNVAANNGGCEYDLTPNNIDAGGNESNGKLVTLKAGCTE